MHDLQKNVHEKLNSLIKDMSDNHWLFTKNPSQDFSRQHLGKLTFYDTIHMLISMGKDTLASEIRQYFDMDPDAIPSKSAFIQRRNQISLSAFEYLFKEFSASFPDTTHRFKDKCILAADGSHLVYSTNSLILEDYNKPRLEDYRGYNHMHLNAFVDTISKVIMDVVIQPGQQPDERDALHTMLDHFSPEQPQDYIITADRGYESYDLIFHCELKNLFYVFRVKDPKSKKCILHTFSNDLPDNLDSFDQEVSRFATDKKTKIIKDQKEVYIYMNPNKNIPHFYPLLGNLHIHYLKFRVLKIQTGDNSVEYLITNLPHSFSMDDIKEIYHYRWGCEVVFRYLKHAAGLLSFHSKKPEFLKQEIYTTLILYNFSIFHANAASKQKLAEASGDNKYIYDIDFAEAIRACREYLLRKPYQPKVDLIRIISMYVHAVKEQFRKFPRYLRGIGAIRFSYR